MFSAPRAGAPVSANGTSRDGNPGVVRGGVLAELVAAKLEIAQLNEALVSRSTIDQAKGMIMASVHCDEHAAFALLKRVSQDANVKVRDIASVMAEHVRCGGDPMECLERYLPDSDDTA